MTQNYVISCHITDSDSWLFRNRSYEVVSFSFIEEAIRKANDLNDRAVFDKSNVYYTVEAA